MRKYFLLFFPFIAFYSFELDCFSTKCLYVFFTYIPANDTVHLIEHFSFITKIFKNVTELRFKFYDDFSVPPLCIKIVFVTIARC